MKKKVRKFAEGGGVGDDVRQRAKFFAALADKPEAQQDFVRSVREAQQAEAEASDRAKLPPPSRPTPTPARPTPTASRQERPAYPTAQRMADAASASYAGDFDVGSPAPSELREADVSLPDMVAKLNSSTRGMGSTSPRSASGLIPRTPFDEAQDTRIARRHAQAAQAEAANRASKQEMGEVLERASPSKPSMTNTMGQRAAQQMEEKGSIYSPDYGKSRSERERPARERKALSDYEATVAAEDAAVGRGMMRRRASENERKGKEAEREREASKAREESRRTIEANRSREEAQEGAARRLTSAQLEQRKGRETEAVRSAAKADERERAMPREAIKSAPKRLFSSRAESSPRARALAERKRRERDTARGAVQGEAFKSGGMVGPASKRADGIASKGKTRGRIY